MYTLMMRCSWSLMRRILLIQWSFNNYDYILHFATRINSTMKSFFILFYFFVYKYLYWNFTLINIFQCIAPISSLQTQFDDLHTTQTQIAGGNKSRKAFRKLLLMIYHFEPLITFVSSAVTPGAWPKCQHKLACASGRWWRRRTGIT